VDIEEQLTLTREEQLALPPTVRIDITDAPLLGDTPPIDDPRAYNMTDAEALAWNEEKAASRLADDKESHA
jgi:hypothetical protein